MDTGQLLRLESTLIQLHSTPPALAAATLIDVHSESTSQLKYYSHNKPRHHMPFNMQHMLFTYGSSQFEVIRCITSCKLRYAIEMHLSLRVEDAAQGRS